MKTETNKESVFNYYSSMLSTLSNMNRYNGSQRLHIESVSEHSFNVVVFASLFCKANHFSSELSLAVINAAISHDMAESVVSDIHHEAKSAIQEFSNCKIADLETKVMKSRFVHFYKDFCRSEGIKSCDDPYSESIPLTLNSNLIHLICKYCDILDVLMYIQIERELGNNFHINDNDVIKRLQKVKIEIKEQYEYIVFIDDYEIDEYEMSEIDEYEYERLIKNNE